MIGPSQSRAGGLPIALSGYWFQDRSLESFLQTARSLGIGSVGLWPGHFEGWPPEAVRSTATRTGLSIYCLNVSARGPRLNTSDADEETAARAGIERVLDFAAKIGVGLVQTYAASRQDLNNEEVVDSYAQQLRPSVAAAEGRGLKNSVENKNDRRGEEPNGVNPCRRPESLRRLAEAVESDAFGITFDPCNFLFTGAGATVAAFEALRPHIVSVELKDAVPVESSIDDATGTVLNDSHIGSFRVVPLGEGVVDVASLLAVLDESGYRGPLVLDPFAASDHVEGQVRASLTFLRSRGGRSNPVVTDKEAAHARR